MTEDRERWQALVNAVMNLRVPLNAREFVIIRETVSFSGRILFRGVSRLFSCVHKLP